MGMTPSPQKMRDSTTILNDNIMETSHIPALSRAVKRGQISGDASSWVDNMVNPFPDYPQKPVGVPSEAPAHTATKIVQKVVTIGAPTTPQESSTTWTATVWLLPVDGAPIGTEGSVLSGCAVFRSYFRSFGELLNQSGNAGLLMVCKAWDTSNPDDANPFSPNFDPAKTQIEFLTLADAWAGEGAMRLAACGYEIVDNTPELYRGGNMVNWRKTSGTADMAARIELGAGITASAQYVDNVRMFTGFPTSQAEAFRIPGSTQTRFTEGTYVTGTFNSKLEEFEESGGTRLAVMCSGIPTGSDSVPALAIGGTPNGNDQFGDQTRDFRPFAYTHLDHSGSYCTGLAPEVSFSLSLKAVVEILPNASSVLVDFATKSTPTEPRAVELYSKIAAKMPVAAPVADNDAGEWFRKMIKIATPLIADIFPEFAPIIKPLAGMAERGVVALSKHHKEKASKRKTAAKTNQKHIR